MTKKIAPRQIYLLLACIAPVGKLVFLPAHLARYAQNDLLFPALVQYLVQAGAVFLVLLLAKRGMSFYEMLENTFGKIAAKILICIFGLFLLYCSFLPLLEQQLFVQSEFYDTLPSLVAFGPFFIFSVYLCSKPLSSFGRTWDILAPLAAAGFVGILLLSVGSADFGALAPAGAAGGSGFLQATAAATSWFFDAAILMTLLGKFEYQKGMAWKGTLCYLAGGAAVLFFLATFYGIFGPLAFNQLFGFSKTSKYFAGITVLGRIDYIFIYGLALVMAFYVALPLQGGIDCAVQAIGEKKYLRTFLSIGVNAVLFALLIVLEYRMKDVLSVISGTLFWIFPIFFLLVPALSLLLRRRRREV